MTCMNSSRPYGQRPAYARHSDEGHYDAAGSPSVAARFATGLSGSDATELSTVSEEFEKIADLIAAIDAAARAPVRRHAEPSAQ